jgi:restriction endonuclease Mrr
VTALVRRLYAALLRSLKQGHTPTVPIPTFDKMLDPLLVIAAREPLTRRTATTAMQQHFNLTEEERNARIPSGQSTFVGNRAGWAMTFLTKAGLIEKVAAKTYRATKKGIALRAQHPNGITLQALRALAGWDEACTLPKTAVLTLKPPPLRPKSA